MAYMKTENKNRRRLRVFIRFAAVILWCALIFSMSARPADLSSQDSGRLVNTIVHVLHRDFDQLPEQTREQICHDTEVVVRKSAHMAEYAVLGILFLAWAKEAFLAWTPLQLWLLSWGLAVLYAATDEFHQTLVPGRSGEVRDVLFDAAGAAIGLAVFLLFRRFVKKGDFLSLQK